MIRFSLSLSLAAALVGTSALSQVFETPDTQPIGSGGCETWDVGFEYASCDRMEWPGSEGGYQQIYTLPAGERRSFRFDPQVSLLARSSEAVSPDTSSEPSGDRGRSLPMTIAEQIAARKAEQGKPAPSENNDKEDDTPHRRRSAAAAASSQEIQQDEIVQQAEAPQPDLEMSLSDSSSETSRDNPLIEPRGPDQSLLRQSRREAGGSSRSVTDSQPPVVVQEEFVLPNQVTIIPGRAELMPMAIGHLNRIETPFTDPMVRTSAAADALSVEFDQNFVYVSLNQAVTLFIHERGHPDPAVVVALIPEQIAPRQVRINVPSTIAAQIKKQAPRPTKPTATGAGKTSGPRANTAGVTRQNPAGLGSRSAKAVRDLRTFSEGKMPRGFQHGQISNYHVADFCRGAQGVTFSFNEGSMIFDGTNYIVRGMAETRSGKPIDLNEQWCMQQPGSLAAGFFPKTQISQGSPTDFFVIVTRPELYSTTVSTKGDVDG